MLKHLNFFVLFCLFVCLVFVRGGVGVGRERTLLGRNGVRIIHLISNTFSCSLINLVFT